MSSFISCTFDGFSELADILKKVNGNLQTAADECLKTGHEIITAKADEAIKKHRRTGRTEESLIAKPKVKWAGSEAAADVGFRISKGGLPSIFLMYGTPKTAKDQMLYDAFHGKKTGDEIIRRQTEIMKKYISLSEKRSA